MKKLFLLGLVIAMIPIFAYSQSSGKAEKTNRFGIGVGYSFNNLFGDSIHPVELTFKYKINEKHAVYLNVPFRLSKKSSNFNYSLSSSEGNMNARNNLYGIGGGYDYNVPVCTHLEGFVGIGFEYLHLDILTKNNLLTKNEKNEVIHNSHYKYSNNRKAYSLLPQMGLRYTIGHFETEVRYKLYMAKIRDTMDEYEIFEVPVVGESRTYRAPINETKLQGALSFNISYFF